MSIWMVLSGRPKAELNIGGSGLGARWGLCWADCTVSMVLRYVHNMIKFENNDQPGTIPAPPCARPHRRRQSPYPVPSSALSHTLVRPTAPHSPPLGIPKRCPSLHPRSHTCQGCTPSPSPSPRTALQARRRRLPALYSTTVTRRQCDCHARRKLRQMRVRVMMQGAGGKGMT